MPEGETTAMYVMNLGDTVGHSLEKMGSKTKVISPKIHGFIDYGHAAFFLGFGLLCRRRNKAASNAALATGAFVLVQSLLTDYPLGVKPVISFETHGKMDGAFAASSWLVPKLFGFSDTPDAKIFQANSAVESAVVRMTNWSNEAAQQG